MTFSSTPELHAVQGASLAQKVRLIRLLGPLLCTKVNLEGASESCAHAAQQSLTLTPVRMLLVDISSGSEGGASSASLRPFGLYHACWNTQAFQKKDDVPCDRLPNRHGVHDQNCGVVCFRSICLLWGCLLKRQVLCCGWTSCIMLDKGCCVCRLRTWNTWTGKAAPT